MKSIISENDLTYYENKLQNMSCPTKEAMHTRTQMNGRTFAEHIVLQKGKLVKVEMGSGNCVKVGVLMDVGTDHLCLRLGNAPVSAIIPFCRIRAVTVMHNNSRCNVSRY